MALMSAEHRFVIGAGYLIGPLFVGLVGFLVDWFVIQKDRPQGEPRSEARESAPPLVGGVDSRSLSPRRVVATEANKPESPGVASGKGAGHERFGRYGAHAREVLRHPWRSLTKNRTGAAVGSVAASTVFGIVLLQPPEKRVFVVQSVALFLVVLAAIGHSNRHPSHHHRLDERVAVFTLVLVLAGAIALVYEQRFAPTVFDDAQVRLRDSTDPVQGGYITTTDTAVLLITHGDHKGVACPMITAVRRDQIQRVWVGPGKLKVVKSEACAQSERPLLDVPSDRNSAP